MDLLKPFNKLSFIKIVLRKVFRLFLQKSARFLALLFTIGLCLSLVFSGCTSSQNPNSTTKLAGGADTAKVVRIGYGKVGTLYLVKQQGSLEKKLSASGISVNWLEFGAPSQLVEAMSSDKIDIGHSGDGPPIFALSKGVPLVYVGNTAPSPESFGILVSKKSPIKTVADLKGKKIAVTKGGTTNIMLVQALVSEGMKYTDIEPAYIAPIDSRAAVETGRVDAWVSSDPYMAAAQKGGELRMLKDGNGLLTGREFYFTLRNFANTNPELLKQILDEIDKTGQWAKQNPRQVAEILSKPMGVDVSSLELAESRRKRYGVQPINNEVIAEQQKVVQTLLDLKVITKPVKVADAVWQPK